MINTLHELYIHQIKDLRSAEKQIIDALPGMIERVECKDLRNTLNDHLNKSHEQVRRIETILRNHNLAIESERCQATAGLIEEGEHLLKEMAGNAIDAGIIASSQRIKHYEISAYGTAKEYADKLDYSDDVNLLDESLDEESDADKELTKLATGGFFSTGVNDKAVV